MTVIRDLPFTQHFELTPDEGIYGLGQHQSGYFNYRGKTVKLVQANTEAVTSISYLTPGITGFSGIIIPRTVFDDNAEGASTGRIWAIISITISLPERNMDAVISGYRHLTGKAPCTANGHTVTGRARNIMIRRPN